MFVMCFLQEPPFDMDIVVSSNKEALAPKPKVKKARKVKNKTGVEVVQEVLKTPEPQIIVN